MQNLYKDFRVAETAVPYFLMHVKAVPDAFDIKLQADMLKFFFKPKIEMTILEKLKSYLWSKFNKIQA